MAFESAFKCGFRECIRPCLITLAVMIVIMLIFHVYLYFKFVALARARYDPRSPIDPETGRERPPLTPTITPETDFV